MTLLIALILGALLVILLDLWQLPSSQGPFTGAFFYAHFTRRTAMGAGISSTMRRSSDFGRLAMSGAQYMCFLL